MSEKMSVKIKGNNTFEGSQIIVGKGNKVTQKSENALERV